MSMLRFNGRVAIVTGAGGDPSIGRAHALLLATRGARVVVNDIGRDAESPGYAGSASAEAVAAEIRAGGGEAVADTHSVASEAGCEAVVKTAIDAFGRLDILVNNAGLSLAAPFDVLTSRDFVRHINVNLFGAAWMCRAAWPHMRARRYGRIVNTGSGAFAGLACLSAYAASKGAIFSLTRALACEGEAVGIKVNTLNPGAFSRMVAAQQHESSPMYQHARENLPAALVSPVAAYLAHEQCPVSGECFEAVGGVVRRILLAQTPGFTDTALTIETLVQRWDEVMAAPEPQLIGCGAYDATQWGLKPSDGASCD